VLVYGDATNSMHFGEQVLISATWTSTVIAPATEPSITIEPRMMRFIAVVILSLICMFHYFTARGGRALNQALAFGKFVALLALIGLGARTVQENRQAGANYPLTPTRTLSNTAAALLLVLFSFQGWENATFVCYPLLISDNNPHSFK
jgi:amino acid transporter